MVFAQAARDKQDLIFAPESRPRDVTVGGRAKCCTPYLLTRRGAPASGSFLFPTTGRKHGAQLGLSVPTAVARPLYHSHPHRQRTESHSLNFFSSDLQVTQVRVHIRFLHHAAYRNIVRSVYILLEWRAQPFGTGGLSFDCQQFVGETGRGDCDGAPFVSTNSRDTALE
jgi:hypothetical protein